MLVNVPPLHALVFSLLLSVGALGRAEESALVWETDYAKARKRALAENRPLFLYYTGSDWCILCRKLDKTIFSDQAIQKNLQENWVPVKLDELRKRRMPKARERHLDQVKRMYKIQAPPAMLLVDPSTETSFIRFSYLEINPVEFLDGILRPGLHHWKTISSPPPSP